jgi:hypothetical protein
LTALRQAGVPDTEEVAALVAQLKSFEQSLANIDRSIRSRPLQTDAIGRTTD